MKTATEAVDHSVICDPTGEAFLNAHSSDVN